MNNDRENTGKFIAPSTMKILLELCEAPRSIEELAKVIHQKQSDARAKIIKLREHGFDIRYKKFRKGYRGGKGVVIYYLKR